MKRKTTLDRLKSTFHSPKVKKRRAGVHKLHTHAWEKKPGLPAATTCMLPRIQRTQDTVCGIKMQMHNINSPPSKFKAQLMNTYENTAEYSCPHKPKGDYMVRSVLTWFVRGSIVTNSSDVVQGYMS